MRYLFLIFTAITIGCFPGLDNSSQTESQIKQAGESCVTHQQCSSGECFEGICPSDPSFAMCSGEACVAGTCPQGQKCISLDDGEDICIPDNACDESLRKMPGESCEFGVECNSDICVGFKCPGTDEHVKVCAGPNLDNGKSDYIKIKMPQKDITVSVPKAVCK